MRCALFHEAHVQRPSRPERTSRVPSTDHPCQGRRRLALRPVCWAAMALDRPMGVAQTAVGAP